MMFDAARVPSDSAKTYDVAMMRALMMMVYVVYATERLCQRDDDIIDITLLTCELLMSLFITRCAMMPIRCLRHYVYAALRDDVTSLRRLRHEIRRCYDAYLLLDAPENYTMRHAIVCYAMSDYTLTTLLFTHILLRRRVPRSRLSPRYERRWPLRDDIIMPPHA